MVRAALVVLAALVLTPAPVPDQPAQAQLFDRLFGPRPGAAERGQPGSRPAQPPPRRGFFWQRRQLEEPLPPPRQVRRAPDPTPRLVVEPKDPAALKLLVVGDFLAASLAAGLDQAFAKEPRVAVIERTEGSSGLVRTDHYDWNTELATILNEQKPDYVVVLLGANDRQQMRLPEGRVPFRSEDWEKAYRSRVMAIADTLKTYGRPAFWIGAPPLRGETASADMIYLNGLYETAIEAAGGKFIDVWGGFADAAGNFVYRGPDIEGQERALRTSDGINFTRAGQRKLAFYVDREVRLSDQGGGAADTFLASTAPGNRIEILPDGSKRLVGPVIVLSEPPPGASKELLGIGPTVAPDSGTPQYRLVIRGETLAAVAGRVDDFRWPPQERQAAIAAPATEDLAAAAPADAAAPAATP